MLGRGVGWYVLVFQAIAARKLESESRGTNRVFDVAATIARSASLKRRSQIVAKSGAEVGGAIAKGGAVIAKGGVEVLAAGPNLAASLVTAHAEVGTGREEAEMFAALFPLRGRRDNRVPKVAPLACFSA